MTSLTAGWTHLYHLNTTFLHGVIVVLKKIIVAVKFNQDLLCVSANFNFIIFKMINSKPYKLFASKLSGIILFEWDINLIKIYKICMIGNL